MYSWLLEFYVLVTSKVISRRVLNYDSVISWQLYNAAPLGNQPAGIITQYPTQSHYLDTELTNSFPILLIPNTSDSIDFISQRFDSTWNWTCDLLHKRPMLYWFGHQGWYVYTYLYVSLYMSVYVYIYIYTHRVSPKMYSLFECPLLIYILILFQVQIKL